MLFSLKKVITSFLMPLPALLLIGLLGLVLLWANRAQKFAKLCLTLSLLGIGLLSFYPLSSTLIQQYELQYPKFEVQNYPNYDYVMVLGGAHVNDPARSNISQLSGESLHRIIEGIRIWQAQPDSILIVSGYDGNTDLSHAELLASTAMQLGVPKDKIIKLTQPKDTQGEALAARSIIESRPFVLVSSSSHLPRAIQNFNDLGLNPIPAPAYYLAANTINQPWHYWRPKAHYLYQSERFWHEWLGTRWQQLKAYLSDEPDQPHQPSES